MDDSARTPTISRRGSLLWHDMVSRVSALAGPWRQLRRCGENPYQIARPAGIAWVCPKRVGRNKAAGGRIGADVLAEFHWSEYHRKSTQPPQSLPHTQYTDGRPYVDILRSPHFRNTWCAQYITQALLHRFLRHRQNTRHDNLHIRRRRESR